MKSIVVYESLWGNTAAIARAIAEGLGAEAYHTSEATSERLAGVTLIVAGAPVLGFSLPSDGMRENIRMNYSRKPTPPDLSHPSMLSWLNHLQSGQGLSAAFETRLWWSPGGSTAAILRMLAALGYPSLEEGKRFIVTGTYGPLRRGELERARAWGAVLASQLRQSLETEAQRG